MNDRLFDVHDEIVVITGASGQLGFAYQSAFLSRGARVVGLDIHKTAVVGALEKQFQKIINIRSAT